MTSGAPLANNTWPPPDEPCKVAMNLCSDSKGMTSTRGDFALLGSPLQPELGCKRVQRPLGRVALHLPDTVLLTKLRIVAQHGHASHALQHGVLAGGPAIAQDLSLDRIPVAGDL